MWGNFLQKVPPHPFKNSLTKNKRKMGSALAIPLLCLVGGWATVVRSRSCSDKPPGCHSLHSRRFATSRASRKYAVIVNKNGRSVNRPYNQILIFSVGATIGRPPFVHDRRLFLRDAEDVIPYHKIYYFS